MQTALNREYITVDDYLAGEEISQVKHEYSAGAVYAMAGATREHNRIAGNVYSAFGQHLRSGPCQAFISDVKLRFDAMGDEVFYYPDVMVGCDPRDTDHLYLRYPKVLVEVSPESTERLDRGEKRLAYQTIETLQEYVIVAQDRPEITIFRRANKWAPELVAGLSESVWLKSIDLTLAVSAIYEGVLKPHI
jgi:Uma2 family endonuclease